jgi:hypothetical protein
MFSGFAYGPVSQLRVSGVIAESINERDGHLPIRWNWEFGWTYVSLERWTRIPTS